MDVITLLRQQLRAAHETLEATMSDVNPNVAHFVETNKALPVGAAYAHAVIAEDMILATMLAGTTPLSSGNEETGLSEPMPGFDAWDKHEAWARSVKVDLTKLREFAKSVYQATDAYLAGLKAEDLDKELDLPVFGKQNLAHVISTFVILHIANLTGEISAAKGFQGHKGYPF